MRHRAARNNLVANRSSGHFASGRNIYLIGLMGSGKSTVGPALAHRLGWKFVDTDRVIEKMAHRLIRKIFEEDGEAAFRRLEQRAIAAVARKPSRVAAGTARNPGYVVAVGGGAVTNPKNVSAMRRTGIVVYLQVSASAALRRVENEGIAKRPLLSGHAAKDRLRVLRRLMALRGPIYSRCCDVRIRAAAGRPDSISTRIVRRLGLENSNS